MGGGGEGERGVRWGRGGWGGGEGGGGGGGGGEGRGGGGGGRGEGGGGEGGGGEGGGGEGGEKGTGEKLCDISRRLMTGEEEHLHQRIGNELWSLYSGEDSKFPE